MRLLKMLLPIIVLVGLAAVGGSVWLAYWIAKPPVRAYLVTPEKFSHLSERGVKVTEETWTNKDGSKARGWLLRGAANSPAVVLLHRYGADRSWLLNLGVKLNEATNFTVLWPDLRGHGENPTVKWTTFGTQEAGDVSAAIDYLGSLKDTQGQRLVGDQIGIYGVELGGYAALIAAGSDTGVRSLALDSVPSTPDQLVGTVVKERTGFDNGLFYMLARGGMRLYFFKQYQNAAACNAAAVLTDRHVLLLAGGGAGVLHNSTIALARYFPNPSSVDVNSDLLITGFDLPAATSEQSEAYDRRVIEFFDKSLRVKR
jgi:pimeloyl-ACP methyl ester carboxylesterase